MFILKKNSKEVLKSKGNSFGIVLCIFYSSQ